MADGPILTSSNNSGLPGISSGSAVSHSTSVPPALAKLPPATVISGFVRSIDARGRIILQTALGDFRLHSTLPLQTGDDVVIRIEAPAPQFLARITTINGLPPQQLFAPARHLRTDVLLTALESEGATPRTAASESSTSAARPAATELRIAAMQHSLLGARVLTAASAPPAYTLEDGKPLPPLPTGSQLQLRLLGHQLPSSATLTELSAHAPNQTPGASLASGGSHPASPTTAPPGTPTASSGATPATAPGISGEAGKPGNLTVGPSPVTSAAGSATVLPSAMQAYNRSLALDGSTPYANRSPSMLAVSSTSSQASAPGTLTGIVLGHEPSGLLVRSPVGTLLLSSEFRLPPGSEIRFSLTSVLPTSAAALEAEATDAPERLLTRLAERWSTLEQAMGLLREHASPTVQQSLLHAMPDAKNPGPGLLFFLTALTGRALRSPLPEPLLRALETIGEAPLADRLQQEFSALSRLNQDRAAPWQSWFIPLQDENAMQQMRFYIQQKEKQQMERGNEQRFVVELSLSRFGNLQLDGLFHPTLAARQLDLIFRHQQPLPKSLKQGVLDVYRLGSEAWGLQGSLQFAHLPEFPVHPLEEILHYHSKPVTA